MVWVSFTLSRCWTSNIFCTSNWRRVLGYVCDFFYCTFIFTEEEMNQGIVMIIRYSDDLRSENCRLITIRLLIDLSLGDLDGMYLIWWIIRVFVAWGTFNVNADLEYIHFEWSFDNWWPTFSKINWLHWVIYWGNSVFLSSPVEVWTLLLCNFVALFLIFSIFEGFSWMRQLFINLCTHQ